MYAYKYDASYTMQETRQRQPYVTHHDQIDSLQVIKVGTSSLVREEQQTLNLSNLARICDTVKWLHSQGTVNVTCCTDQLAPSLQSTITALSGVQVYCCKLAEGQTNSAAVFLRMSASQPPVHMQFPAPDSHLFLPSACVSSALSGKQCDMRDDIL